MLRPAFDIRERRAFERPIAEASFPVPFEHCLEFNAPAHGTWNIVHTGMLVPEAHQIYVCGPNCMRGVVLTAAEMAASERFHMVLVEERDVVLGRLDEVTIEGVAAVLEGLDELPPCVLVFTVCTHRLIGCDLDFVYRELERRFPAVRFLRCYMEPITQKGGPAPDERLRKTMFDVLEAGPPAPQTLAVLGGDFALDSDADLRRLAEANGWQLLEPQGCSSFAEFCELGRASVLASIYPRAASGAAAQALRLGREHLHLPMLVSLDDIEAQERELCERLGWTGLDASQERAACDAALEQARIAVGGAAVAIDQAACLRPLGLARLLLEHGLDVQTVYLDAAAPVEEADFRWLQANKPQLRLASTMRPEARVEPRGAGQPVVALGQLAAWREATGHFVNLVEGGGLWGFAGIRSLAVLIQDAAEREKDTRDLVPRKGLGCVSCL